MIRINNYSDTLIIVVHEIYGINDHMKWFCEMLSQESLDVICPNLYKQGISFDYAQEAEAYRYFMDHVGFMYAFNKVKDAFREMKAEYNRIFIVGFSVGATIAWLCSQEKGLNGIVGYYGSRIRDYKQISPTCPTLLFFPEQEHSFNVSELIVYLQEKYIEIHTVKGEHGFSDPFSPVFNKQSAQLTFDRMSGFINKKMF
ncbi:hypothetical protein J6TS1_37940 [Siminovitchia terrae]|uniref:Dienelactone hydrolase family protein n=1 Tax=Siminovitchia terrae TaxID=1914933 RepID=A0A429XA75_SIMTE|nr:dienelactone hydrolase family protein [Siminovitchia terrae]RST60296.1 dienelactone hydrolase family protein [Siminovitchia terrae]GIN89782.1 hypothetical protein J22TS1_08330 [Siminovitchia terrae]GIN97924.1 hypothetical protein J6TS1_37940 [Siminovitchia terrae]